MYIVSGILYCGHDSVIEPTFALCTGCVDAFWVCGDDNVLTRFGNTGVALESSQTLETECCRLGESTLNILSWDCWV